MALTRRQTLKALAVAPIIPSVLYGGVEQKEKTFAEYCRDAGGCSSAEYSLRHDRKEGEPGATLQDGRGGWVRWVSFPGELIIAATVFPYNPADGTRDIAIEFKWQTFFNEPERCNIDRWLVSMYDNFDAAARDLSQCCDFPMDCCGQQICDCRMRFIQPGDEHWCFANHYWPFPDSPEHDIQVPSLKIPGHPYDLKLASVTYGKAETRVPKNKNVHQAGRMETTNMGTSRS